MKIIRGCNLTVIVLWETKLLTRPKQGVKPVNVSWPSEGTKFFCTYLFTNSGNNVKSNPSFFLHLKYQLIFCTTVGHMQKERPSLKQMYGCFLGFLEEGSVERGMEDCRRWTSISLASHICFRLRLSIANNGQILPLFPMLNNALLHK